MIIKAGTCAVIDTSIGLGEALIPSFVVYNKGKILLDFDNIPTGIFFKVKKYIIQKGLITLDEPLCDQKKALKYLSDNIVCADMETFFLIEKSHNLSVIPLLVGTDRGDNDARADFKKSLNKASFFLKSVLIKILADFVLS